MRFQRHLILHNRAIRSPIELRPEGITVYSSGSPCDRYNIARRINRDKHPGSVHALIDSTGISLLVPVTYQTNPLLEDIPTSNTLNILCCDPSMTVRRVQPLTDAVIQNLICACIFLSRQCNLADNGRDFIQFAGTANWKFQQGLGHPGYRCDRDTPSLITRSVITDELTRDSDIHAFNQNITKVMVELDRISEQVLKSRSRSAVDAIGAGDVVLFTGGEVYISRGTSTELTSWRAMEWGVVRTISLHSTHPYEIIFPGRGPLWVNKSTLVPISLGVSE